MRAPIVKLWIREAMRSPLLIAGLLLQALLFVYLSRGYASGRWLNFQLDHTLLAGAALAPALLGYLHGGRWGIENRRDADLLDTHPLSPVVPVFLPLGLGALYGAGSLVVSGLLVWATRFESSSGLPKPSAWAVVGLVPVVGTAAGFLVANLLRSARWVATGGLGTLLLLGANGFASPWGRTLSLWSGSGNPSAVLLEQQPATSWRVAYLTGLVLVFVALAAGLVDRQGSERRVLVPVLAVGVGFSLIGALAARDRLGAIEDDPATGIPPLHCVAQGALESCALAGFEDWRDDWSGVALQVVQDLPGPAPHIRIVQTPALDLLPDTRIASLGPLGADDVPVSLTWAGDGGDAASVLRLSVASRIVGLPLFGEVACRAEGPRGALGLWLAGRHDRSLRATIEYAQGTYRTLGFLVSGSDLSLAQALLRSSVLTSVLPGDIGSLRGSSEDLALRLGLSLSDNEPDDYDPVKAVPRCP